MASLASERDVKTVTDTIIAMGTEYGALTDAAATALRECVVKTISRPPSRSQLEILTLGLKVTASGLWQEVMDIADLRTKVAEMWREASDRRDAIVAEAQATALTIIAKAQALAESRAQDAIQKREQALEQERQRYEQMHKSLLEPYAAARMVFDELVQQAGYAREGYGGRREPIPSPVLCHIATMVAAVCGTNPVHIQFGAKPDGKAE